MQARSEPIPSETRIADRLADLIVRNLNVSVPRESITQDTAILDGGLELDSFALVEIVGLAEAEFGIQFTREDFSVNNFKTIAILAGTVAKRIREQAGQ